MQDAFSTAGILPAPAPSPSGEGAGAASAAVRRVLLELDSCSSLLELRLHLLGLVLGRALLDGGGSLVGNSLGLLQSQACQLTDDLDHLDLLVTGTGQHDVEGTLLLLLAATAAAAADTSQASSSDFLSSTSSSTDSLFSSSTIFSTGICRVPSF